MGENYTRASRRQLGLTSLQLKFYFDSHPEFGEKSAETLEMQLWEEFAKGGVLLAPGRFFSADQENILDGKYEGHYRVSFSTVTVRVCPRWSCWHLIHIPQFLDMEKAIDVIAKVMKLFLGMGRGYGHC